MLTIKQVKQARVRIKAVITNTPLVRHQGLSEAHGASISLKREDLQPVRSYKIRGAYNKIASLNAEERSGGIVCASAGNHAQGVAYACNSLNIKATIFMPHTTPQQKINKVRLFGKGNVAILLEGNTFDEACSLADRYCKKEQTVFIHPFDDEAVIAGQGTIALELLEAAVKPIDFLFVPIGGGGLAAGICTVFHQLSPQTAIIGVEPLGAAAMKTSIRNGHNTTLEYIDKFVDGAAVKRVGEKTFAICKDILKDIILVPEGKVCATLLKLYNEDAMVVEPAGALTIAALDFYSAQIKGKNVVCIVSGSNNDINRIEAIKERALDYERTAGNYCP